MRKIPTMFVRKADGDRQVTDEITPGCERALRGELRATEKLDGTACLYKDGKWWKRCTLKPGKKTPAEFLAAQEEPMDTGKMPGWMPVGDGPADKHHRSAIETLTFEPKEGATYELIGSKVEKNPYGITGHLLMEHGAKTLIMGRDAVEDCSFDGLRALLDKKEIEGIVFWDDDGPVCKIKRRDFGLPWPVIMERI